uniref:ATP-dependent nuclease n=1 Tax=Candidatus Electrothrix sp. TaxID=2170559 RepID=UPI004056AB7D
MEQQTIIIPNLAIAGYRSFSKEPQYFDQFAKINLFIGQNNAGKSNVLRFLMELYQQASEQLHDHHFPKKEFSLDYALVQHLPDKPGMLLGTGEKIDIDELPPEHRLITHLSHQGQRSIAGQHFLKVMKKKAETDDTLLCWTLYKAPVRQGGTDIENVWSDAVASLLDSEIEELWKILTGKGYGGHRDNLEPDIRKRMATRPVQMKAQLIPAIRRIGEKGSSSDDFDGTGIIDRLAKLQHPSKLSSYQSEKKQFEDITNFLRDVVDCPDAVVEIPEEKHTIHVHMDGKVLPIESLGTGIHEVVILAAAATVLSKHVVCIEEPELHLNPILQRKLIRYLSKHTDNQYFITTHSNVLMDVPDAEIYHIKLVKGASIVERVTSGRQKSAVYEDLGYHPSDLLQANCIIWVEGPSDRIYLNWWLESMDKDLVEGIHYSIMFYGGRLLSHLSNAEIDQQHVDDFISLRRLNNRGVILIDSDRRDEDSDINATKQRLQDEFDSGPGHAWITQGREIENYLLAEQVEAAIKAVHPKVKEIGPFGKYDNTLKIQGGGGNATQADKIKVAREITKQNQPDLSMYDLKTQLNKLIEFIWESNSVPAAPKDEQHVLAPV